MAGENGGVIVMGELVEEDLMRGVGATKVDHPAGGSQDGTLINISSFGYLMIGEWIPTSIVAGGTVSRNFDAPGAETYMPVTASFTGPGYLASPYLSFHCKVDQQNRLLVSIHNHHTTDTISPGGGNVSAVVFYIPEEV